MSETAGERRTDHPGGGSGEGVGREWGVCVCVCVRVSHLDVEPMFVSLVRTFQENVLQF